MWTFETFAQSVAMVGREAGIAVASFDVCSSGNNHRHHKATFVDFLLDSLTAHWSTTKLPGQVRCETFTF